MDNLLTFLIPSDNPIPDLADYLTVRLIGQDGQSTGVSLPVSETDTPGYYSATMVGPSGIYGAVLMFQGTTPVALDATREFVWNGTSFEHGSPTNPPVIR